MNYLKSFWRREIIKERVEKVKLFRNNSLEKKKEKTLFLNFDFDSHKKFLKTQTSLVNKIKFEFGKSRGYVFIDEIQRRENAGIYLQGIYDLNLPYKFIVSGSGSIELKEKIHEIYNSYIERDLVTLLNISDVTLFKNIFKMLGNLSGKLINFSNIAQDTDTSFQTLKKYLHFAEKTFSIKTISPFFTNKIKEIKKAPMIYFTDIGMMNYAMGKYGKLINPPDLGFVFQNFIFNILKEKIPQNYDVKFRRTTDKAEIDFIIDKINSVVPIEIKGLLRNKLTI